MLSKLIGIPSTLAAILFSCALFSAAAIAQTATPPATSTEAPANANANATPASVTTPPPPVTPPAAPAKAIASEVENPYGLKALWETGDFVAKTTLLILIVMSMGSWYVIITKFWEQSKVSGHANTANKTFWNANTVRQGADALKKESPFRFIAESGLEATKKHDGLLGQVDLNSWITQSIQRAMENVQSRLQDGLAVLATVGSTAPFVGLFGTVWGIYNALVKIGVSGQASIDKVAGPVGEALIMTAIGLAVAVPAVLGYNWLVRRNKSAMEKVRAFGNDLHSVLLSSSNVKSKS